MAVAFSLEPLQESDVAFRYEVFEATIKPYIDQIWGWPESQQRKMIRDQLSAGTHAAIVVDGERVGIVQVEETAESISLSQIEILPEFQSQGIGTAVISMLLAKADAEGKRVVLRVFTLNSGARQLYERMGFAVTAESDHDLEMTYTPVETG